LLPESRVHATTDRHICIINNQQQQQPQQNALSQKKSSFPIKSCWWLFVSILSGSVSELKKEPAFCFRSSIKKQQQQQQ